MDLQKIAQEITNRTKELDKMMLEFEQYQQDLYLQIVNHIETQPPEVFIKFYHSLEDDSVLKFKLFKFVNKKANE